MATVKAIWTGYVGRSSDGMMCVPGAECQVEQEVARANPHYSIVGDPGPVESMDLLEAATITPESAIEPPAEPAAEPAPIVTGAP